MVDALGRPIDGRGPIQTDATSPIESRAPGVVERRPVSESLHTGIKVLDALVPLGRGQRELILGDRKIGKTTVALDVILSQQGSGVVCVYAAIGQKASTLARVVGLLRERGALDYTVVVAALSNEPPAFRHFVPYAACTIAEALMRRGRHALVVYDDLSKHAVTYREISALLKRPIGREAYPGDIFYVHSRLLERAARLRDQQGGGSLTALPIVETLAGDISALIPTNVISICDGQIFLDTSLFNEGSRPAMDVGAVGLSRRRHGADRGDAEGGRPAAHRPGAVPRDGPVRQVRGRGGRVYVQTVATGRAGAGGAETGRPHSAAARVGDHRPYAVVHGYADAIPVEAGIRDFRAAAPRLHGTGSIPRCSRPSGRRGTCRGTMKSAFGARSRASTTRSSPRRPRPRKRARSQWGSSSS